MLDREKTNELISTTCLGPTVLALNGSMERRDQATAGVLSRKISFQNHLASSAEGVPHAHRQEKMVAITLRPSREMSSLTLGRLGHPLPRLVAQIWREQIERQGSVVGHRQSLRFFRLLPIASGPSNPIEAGSVSAVDIHPDNALWRKYQDRRRRQRQGRPMTFCIPS
jgi:hypothetical protein